MALYYVLLSKFYINLVMQLTFFPTLNDFTSYAGST